MKVQRPRAELGKRWEVCLLMGVLRSHKVGPRGGVREAEPRQMGWG